MSENFSDLNHQQRLELAQRLRSKYPDRIPVVFIPSKDLYLTKIKFLVEKDLQFNSIIAVVRKYINLKSHDAIFCIIKNKIPPNTEIMWNIYQQNKHDDGFLYINIRKESTFGYL